MNDVASPPPTGSRPVPSTQPPVKSASRLRLRWPGTSRTGWLTQPPDISKTLWWFLLVTLSVDGLAAVALAAGQLYLASTGFAPLEAAILSAIGIANWWAANSVRQARPTWARDAFIAQLAVLFLAVYVIVIDAFKSPQTMIDAVHTNGRQVAVFAIAVMIGFLALAWVLVLARRAAVQWTKTALIISALFPLAGLLQFWLQTYYIPQTSSPQVDLSVDLSPQGKTGSIIHLSAKVTVHNRGNTNVNVAGALMRVTAYPATTQQQEPAEGCRFNSDYAPQEWCRIERGLDITGVHFDNDYRVNPTPAESAHLLYAGTMISNPTSFLAPGETDTYQRELDLDPSKFRVARLSVSAVFLNQRRIQDIRSCLHGSKASLFTDPQSFSQEVGIAQHYALQSNGPIIDKRVVASYTCIEDDIAPRDIIDWLIGNRVIVRVLMVLEDPQDRLNEYPQLAPWFNIANRWRKPDPGLRISRKITEAIPSTSYLDVSAEYAVADDIQPKATK